MVLLGDPGFIVPLPCGMINVANNVWLTMEERSISQWFSILCACVWVFRLTR